MSGAQTSTGPDPNILYKALSGQEYADVTAANLANQQNQLLMPYRVQGAQQQIGAAEMDTMGRAAAGLLSLPDENARAAAYPGVVQNLQSLGFAKNAPAQYPGEATLRTFVGQALPVEKQYELGIMIPPGLAAALGTGGTPPASGQGGAPGAGGGTTDFNYGNIRPTGAGGGFNSYATPQEGIAAMSHQLQLYAGGSPATGGKPITTLNGLTATWAPKGDGANDPVAYAKALGARLGIDPDAPINLADPMLQMRLIPAMAQIEKGRPFNQPPEVLTAGIRAGLSGKGGTTVAVTGPSGGVVARNPGAVQVAGPGAPTGSTAPAQTDLVGPRPLPPTGPGSPVATPASIANTPYPVTQNVLTPPPPAAPPAPPQPQPPAAQPAGPAPTPPGAPPAPLQIPGTGVDSPQYQRFQQIQAQISQLMPYASLPAAKAKIAQLQAEQGVLMQMDSVVMLPDGRQVHTLTGKVDLPGPPRFTEGEAVRDPQTQQWRQPNPGEQGVPGRWAVGPAGQQFFPAPTEPGEAGYKVREQAYTRDSGQINDISTKGQAAQADQVRIQEMQDQLSRIFTGPGTATKVAMQAWLNRWVPDAVNPFATQTQGLSDAAAAEVFNKLAFRNATTQERSVAGSRGAGAKMTEMFLNSNPGLDLLTDANQRMLNVMRIANQADIDNTQGALNHFAKNEQAFQDSNGKSYASLNNYNADWQAQRNPQVFAAAAAAAAGLPARDGTVNGVQFKGWADELTDAEEARVLAIVARAAPGTRVNTKGGDIIARPQAPATPPMPAGFAPVQ